MKLSKIASLLNPINLIKKINDLIDVARSPLKRSTDYVVGDIVHVYSMPSNMYLECTQAGRTSASTLIISDTVDTVITDGTVKWIVCDKNNLLKRSGGNMTGDITFDVGKGIKATRIQNINLNDLLTEGVYYAGGQHDCTNAPVGNGSGFSLIVSRTAEGYKAQTAMNVSGVQQQRYNNGSTWGEWSTIRTTTSDTSENSTRIATTAFVNNFADANLVKKSGDTMSGNLSIEKSGGASYTAKSNGHAVFFGVGSGGEKRGIYDSERVKWIVYADNDSVLPKVDVSPSATDNSVTLATTAYVKSNVPVSIGSATQPVHTNANGKITACTYSLNKTVPSDAVFTDTVTTATTSGDGNAVTSISASNGALTVTKGTTFVTGVSKGGATQPVYTNASGVATACTMANATTTAGLARVIATNANANTTTTGAYVQVNGMLVQWGRKATTTISTKITFTRAFTSTPSIIIGADNGGDGCIGAVDVSTTGFTAEYESDLPRGTFYWIAIGYHTQS